MYMYICIHIYIYIYKAGIRTNELRGSAKSCHRNFVRER